MFLLKCARQQQGTDWCGYYVCDYLHIMTPCGKATDEDMRVRPNRSLVHFHNCTNAHTTLAPLITASSKWSSPPVLGGVGFKSLVMKGAITAGSQPDGDVPKPSPPVQQPAVLTPSRNKKKLSTPLLLCICPTPLLCIPTPLRRLLHAHRRLLPCRGRREERVRRGRPVRRPLRTRPRPHQPARRAPSCRAPCRPAAARAWIWAPAVEHPRAS